jgi:hypothetical protein
MTTLEKAYLALVTPPPNAMPPSLAALAASATVGNQGIVVFDFNPKELQLQKSAKWERMPQQGAAQTSMPQFQGADPATLTIEIFLDDSEDSAPSVPMDVQLLLNTVTPLSATLGSNPVPPWVVFGWGTFLSFVAIVRSVSAKYTMFKPDGTPVRATCQVTLEEVPTQMPGQNPTSGSLMDSRTHQIVAGDTLQSVAQREYGDPSRWRDLADLNGIDDPMRVEPGRTLLVPSASELPELN